MPKLRLPKIYCDVHIKPGAIEAFTKHVLDNNVKHAGIIEIPPDYDNEEAAAYAELLAEFVAVYIEDDGKHAWRRRIIYLAHDGVTIIHNTGDEHRYSWEELRQAVR